MAHAAATMAGPRSGIGEFGEHSPRNEAHSSGVSWGAVIAGAFVAAALALILLELGAGIGISSISPWSGSDTAAQRIGMAVVIWLILTQIIASSVGGYLAGRLRTKWVNLHTDEVYFRDTAHGFLVWSVGLVIAAAFLATASTAMIGRANQIGAGESTTGVQRSGAVLGANGYFVDELFRSERGAPNENNAAARDEAAGIFAHSLREGNMTSPDRTYVASLVSATSGLNQSDAERRVSLVFAEAQQAAETARKNVAHGLYWTFLALLIGAFCASLAATMGGRVRDRVAAIQGQSWSSEDR
jgi:hypothetical protein